MGRAVAVADSSYPRRPDGAAGPRMVEAAAEYAPVIEQCLRNGGGAYGSEKPSTILVTPRLALPPLIIEIKFIARV